LLLAMVEPLVSERLIRLWYASMSSDKETIKRWHLWYDDYEQGTAFITDETFAETPRPRIIKDNLSYAEALRIVLEHNAPLDAELREREGVKSWPK